MTKSQEQAQQKYREAHRDKLRAKNILTMAARRGDPGQRAAIIASQQRTYFRKKYGLELDQVQQMWISGGGRCGLCQVEKPAPHHGGVHAAHKLVIDHCHTTNRIRGLLCYKCNTALGQLGDSALAIRAVLTYLGDHI